MKTTIELLQDMQAELVRRGESGSRYHVARVLGVAEHTVASWAHGHRMSAESAGKIADFLGQPRALVLLWVAWDSAPGEKAKAEWERAAAARPAARRYSGRSRPGGASSL